MKLKQSFWYNKKVLITGHTGFKGSWLSLWLSNLGANVTGISLPSLTSPNLFSLAQLQESMDSRYIDIREAELLAKQVKDISPEIIFHMAAQPLVRASYSQPLETLETNVMGTANILDSLRDLSSIKVAVMITTDKVYKNKEWLYPYRENDALGGHDPYSASKAASEIIISSYRDSFLSNQGVSVASCRAGNVIGGGDWSEDRLIPDAIKVWQANKPLYIRNPSAVRPWQHVLEPLSGYMLLAEKLWETQDLSGAYNFGPETNTSTTVKEVIEYAKKCYGSGEIIFDETNDTLHEAGLLSLEIAKSKNILGLRSKMSLNRTIEQTINWYKQLSAGASAYDLCIREIQQFEEFS